MYLNHFYFSYDTLIILQLDVWMYSETIECTFNVNQSSDGLEKIKISTYLPLSKIFHQKALQAVSKFE